MNIEENYTTEISEREQLFEPNNIDQLLGLIKTRLAMLPRLRANLESAKGVRVKAAPQKTAIFDLTKRLKNLEGLSDPKGPIKRFESHSNRDALKPRVKLEWGGELTAKQLEALVDAEIERQVAYQIIRYYEKELSVIQETYSKLLFMHSVSVISRLKGRKKNANKNREILQQCLTRLKSLKVGKRLKSIDYVEFKKLARTKEFEPAYIPSPRIAKSRRGLPVPPRRNDWSESTLRKFFKEETKLVPTTKKGKT